MNFIREYFNKITAKWARNREFRNLAEQMVKAIQYDDPSEIENLWKKIDDKEDFLNLRTPHQNVEINGSNENKTIYTMLLQEAIANRSNDLTTFQTIFNMSPDPHFLVTVDEFYIEIGSIETSTPLLIKAIEEDRSDIALFLAQHPSWNPGAPCKSMSKCTFVDSEDDCDPVALAREHLMENVAQTLEKRTAELATHNSPKP